MKDAPSITIEFDPETWQVINTKFIAATDGEYNRLREIMVEGIREAVEK